MDFDEHTFSYKISCLPAFHNVLYKIYKGNKMTKTVTHRHFVDR